MDRIKDIPAIYDLMVNSEKYYFKELKPSHLEENLAVKVSVVCLTSESKGKKF